MHQPISTQLIQQWKDTGIRYQSFSVSTPLSNWVSGIWQMQSTEFLQLNTVFPILPDGRSRLVFAWDDTSCQAWFGSPVTKSYLEKLRANTHYIGYEFHYGSACDVCSTPMNKLGSTLDNVFADLVMESEAQHWLNQLTGTNPLNFLNSWLLSRLVKNQQSDVLKTQTSVAIQRLLQPSANIDQIALSLNTNRRQLLRGFQRYIGLSPSQLKRILRAQVALSELRRSDHHVADVACWANYHDQAHMAHDFRELFQMKPTDVLTK